MKKSSTRVQTSFLDMRILKNTEKEKGKKYNIHNRLWFPLQIKALECSQDVASSMVKRELRNHIGDDRKRHPRTR